MSHGAGLAIAFGIFAIGLVIMLLIEEWTS